MDNRKQAELTRQLSQNNKKRCHNPKTLAKAANTLTALYPASTVTATKIITVAPSGQFQPDVGSGQQ